MGQATITDKTIRCKLVKTVSPEVLTPLLLFIGTMLIYPFIIFPPGLSWGLTRYHFQILTPALFSLLALCLLCLNYRRMGAALLKHSLPGICLLTICLVNFIHFLANDRLLFTHLCLGLFWVSVPLLSYLFANSLARQLPYFLSFLWILNSTHNLVQFITHQEIAGISGNRNWNACLIVYTTPFIVHLILRVMKWLVTPTRQPDAGDSADSGGSQPAALDSVCDLGRTRIVSLIVLSVVLLTFSIFAAASLYYCYSRGANLALLTAIVLVVVFSLKPAPRRKLLIPGLIVVFLGCLVFMFYGIDVASRIIAADIRIPLWESAAEMFKQHPFLGVDRSLFESEFAQFRNGEYFLHPYAAIRSNHPHNHLILFITSNGLFAFLAWLFLILYPLSFAILTLHKETSFRAKLLLFAFLVLITHGQLDLVIFEWPGNIISMFLLGILWNRVWPCPPPSEQAQSPLCECRWLNARGVRSYAVFAFLVLTGCFLYLVSIQTRSSATASDAMLYDKILKNQLVSAYLYSKAQAENPTVGSLYSAGTKSHIYLKNPDLAVLYLNKLEQETPCQNYAHVHGFTGLAYCSKKMFRKALPYLQQETMIYPLSISAWYNLANTQNILGMKRDALYSRHMLLKCIELKGLKPTDLSIILKNPEFDLKPHLLLDSRKKSDIEGAAAK